MKKFQVEIVRAWFFAPVPCCCDIATCLDDLPLMLLEEASQFGIQLLSEEPYGVLEPGIRRIQEIRKELVTDPGKLMSHSVFAECGKHIDRTEATKILLPAEALPSEGKRVNGMDLNIWRELLLSGLPGLAIKNQIESSLVVILLREHDQGCRLPRSGSCVDSDDATTGIQDGPLLGCGFHELA